MYFIIEEIFQDLKCYEKLQDYLDDTELNSILIFDEYYSRFGTTNSQFMHKFIQKLLSIYDFHKNVSQPQFHFFHRRIR